MITFGLLIIYQEALRMGYNETITRTMVFVGLVTANVFLTLVNRSFYYSIITTIKYKNNLILLIIAITIITTGLLLYLDVLTGFFGFEHLNVSQLIKSIGIGFLSVIWYESVKFYKRENDKLLNLKKKIKRYF